MEYAFVRLQYLVFSLILHFSTSLLLMVKGSLLCQSDVTALVELFTRLVWWAHAYVFERTSVCGVGEKKQIPHTLSAMYCTVTGLMFGLRHH